MGNKIQARRRKASIRRPTSLLTGVCRHGAVADAYAPRGLAERHRRGDRHGVSPVRTGVPSAPAQPQ